MKEIPVSGPSKIDFKGIEHTFETALEREKLLSDKISRLKRMSDKAGEIYTSYLLEEFCKEQIEEETLFINAMKKIRLFLKADDHVGLDAFLAERKA